MKAIKILQCSDSLMWYRDHVGKVVPLLKEFDDEFLSRDTSGFTNIVKKTDGIIVDAESNEVLNLTLRPWS